MKPFYSFAQVGAVKSISLERDYSIDARLSLRLINLDRRSSWVKILHFFTHFVSWTSAVPVSGLTSGLRIQTRHSRLDFFGAQYAKKYNTCVTFRSPHSHTTQTCPSVPLFFEHAGPLAGAINLSASTILVERQ